MWAQNDRLLPPQIDDDDDDDDKADEDFTPREYQVEIFKIAVERNTIALLGTGTGKTFISVMLIRHLSYELAMPFQDGGKRTIFLVPTVPLVIQQCQTLRNHTNLRVESYYGSKNVDNWSMDRWNSEFVKNQVLVMTAQVCQIILNHGFLPISKINLIIFDECHKAVKNYPYCDIMKCFLNCSQKDQPRILGLTASLVNASIRLEDLEPEIKSLEATLQSTVTTATNILSLKNYGTDPNEHVVFYEDFDFSTRPRLEKIVNFLSEAHNLFSKSELPSALFEVLSSNFLSTPKKCITAISTILTTLGPLCAFHASDLFEKEVQKVLALVQDQEEKYIFLTLQKSLKLVKKKLISFLEGLDREDTILPKLKRLLNVLVFFQKGYPSGESLERLCCIIFVEQRIIACVLNTWLSEISQKYSQYSFIQSQFVIGHSVNSSIVSKLAKMHTSQQTRVLQDFRQEKFNVLIATSVIEEGMDVHTCNLVIRFDPPRDFRSYIQSRGRARAKSASYVLLVNETNKAYLKTHMNFKNIEKHLEKYCFNRQAPREDEITGALANEIIPTFMPDPTDGKPRLTCTSVISLVNRYCSLLDTRSSITLVPEWRMDRIFVSKQPCFRCTLLLPINSPLKEPIQGSAMRSKKHAKMSAAFETCLRLYKMGELDQHFLPVSQRVTTQDLSELGIKPQANDHDPLIGTRKRHHVYPRKLSAPLVTPSEPTRWKHCYAVRMKMVEHRSPETTNYAFCPEKECLALLTHSPIPLVPKIVIYTYYGTIELRHEELDLSLDFTDQQSTLLFGFHHRIFQDMKFVEKLEPVRIKGSPIIVPLNSAGCFNWKLIMATAEHCDKIPSYSTSSPYVFDRSDFNNAVVCPLYRRKKELYFVKMFLDNLTPLSPFPKSTQETMLHFHRHTFSLEITNHQQPLILPRRLHTINLLHPLSTYKPTVLPEVTSQSFEFHRLLVPEIVTIHPVSASLWRQILCLPSYLYRLDSILLAARLQESIAEHWGENQVCWNSNIKLDDSIHLNDRGKSIFIYPYTIPPGEDGSKRVYFDRHPILPHPTSPPTPIVLLHALTAISASDIFNLERLETIGDSFLKYIVTVLIYKRFNTDEGKLHLLRCRLVCNKNLFSLARAKNLPEMLRVSRFDALKMWQPPGFEIKLDIPESEQRMFDSQVISDKSIADVVEALIGAYLLTCGPMGALRFLSWMGLEFLQQEVCLDLDQIHTSPFTWINIPPPSALIKEDQELEMKITILYSTLNMLENQMGYTFRNKLFIIQALTHPSYIYNRVTPCYQRLEFLGDAVLDFIVTSYIYHDSRDYTPGQLTDLRSALVGNSFFSFMAVKYGFDKCLKMDSYSLYKTIKLYKDLRGPNAELSENEQLETYLYQEYDEMTIDTPKILGDLFESVAGAIFLDSGLSLDTVWKIYYPMMKPALEAFSEKLPESVINRLMHLYPLARFESLGVDDRGDFHINLVIPNIGKFYAKGANKVIAKQAACRMVLRRRFEEMTPADISSAPKQEQD